MTCLRLAIYNKSNHFYSTAPTPTSTSAMQSVVTSSVVTMPSSVDITTNVIATTASE